MRRKEEWRDLEQIQHEETSSEGGMSPQAEAHTVPGTQETLNELVKKKKHTDIHIHKVKC